ncbi:MAG: DNA gyrase inhibitor YacG [Bacteriovoracales bacterium]|nr:DNA gyrase inhibitor YacG [Bacteriovoracales bacterium]
MKKEKTISCPRCKKKFNYYASDFRPFCSKRCKMIDLGHWLDESYTICTPMHEDEENPEMEEELGKKEDDF